MNYPTSEVKGSGRDCQASTEQELQRGATPCLRSGAAAGRSYSTSPRRLRPWAAAGWSYPTPEARGGSREELPRVEVRGGGREDLPYALTPEARGGGWEEQRHA